MLNYLNTTPTHIQKQDVIKLHWKNLLTDEVITRGLESYLEQFLYFFKEKEGISLPDKINISYFVNNQELRDQYRDILIGSKEENSFSFLLSTLYSTNPELLKTYIEICENGIVYALKKKR